MFKPPFGITPTYPYPVGVSAIPAYYHPGGLSTTILAGPWTGHSSAREKLYVYDSWKGAFGGQTQKPKG
jgi:hypothetical protein